MEPADIGEAFRFNESDFSQIWKEFSDRYPGELVILGVGEPDAERNCTGFLVGHAPSVGYMWKEAKEFFAHHPGLTLKLLTPLRGYP